MRITPWLKSFSRRVSRRRQSIEHLEDRTLLSVNAFVSNDVLNITMDANEDVRISALGQNVRIEFNSTGQFEDFVGLGSLSTSSLVGITVNAGGGNNSVDASLVNQSFYTAITSIVLDGGETPTTRSTAATARIRSTARAEPT